MTFAFEFQMIWRVVTKMFQTAVREKTNMLVLWVAQGIPVDEFYCWFTFLFDCYFLVDLDGGEGTMGAGGGGSCDGWARVIWVHIWRESKLVFNIIVVRIRSHFRSMLRRSMSVNQPTRR